MSVAPAFRWLCDALARDGRPERRDRLAAFIAGAPDWPALVQLAGHQMVTPALAPALARHGLLDRLPAELGDYLTAAAALNRARNATLRNELLDIARRLNAIGLTPLPLKGAANLLAGLYDDPAERLLLDLDLLVPSARLAEASATLRAAGWRTLGPATAHHAAPLGRPGDAAALELHAQPLDLPWQALLPADEMLSTAAPCTLEGVQLALPGAPQRLLHALAHGALGDHGMALGRLNLRDLDDATRLAALPGCLAAATPARRFAALGQSAALGFVAGAARDLLGAELPVPTAGRRALRRALRLTAQPRRAALRGRVLRPWLLLRRALGHRDLRRRLLRSLTQTDWYRRQWRALRRG